LFPHLSAVSLASCTLTAGFCSFGRSEVGGYRAACRSCRL